MEKELIKWNREFCLMKFSDGRYVSLSSHQTFSLPKSVDKADAYLFTPHKAKLYLENYKDQFDMIIVDVDVYLD